MEKSIGICIKYDADGNIKKNMSEYKIIKCELDNNLIIKYDYDNGKLVDYKLYNSL